MILAALFIPIIGPALVIRSNRFTKVGKTIAGVWLVLLFIIPNGSSTSENSSEINSIPNQEVSREINSSEENNDSKLNKNNIKNEEELNNNSQQKNKSKEMIGNEQINNGDTQKVEQRYESDIEESNYDLVSGNEVKSNNKNNINQIDTGDINENNEEVSSKVEITEENKNEEDSNSGEYVKYNSKKSELSLAKKKKIYKELGRVEDKAFIEAEKRYGILAKDCPEFIEHNPEKQFEYLDKLSLKYQKEIREKFDITLEQQREIEKEGGKNLWPLPSPPDKPECYMLE